jgi:hypothetical protein
VKGATAEPLREPTLVYQVLIKGADRDESRPPSTRFFTESQGSLKEILKNQVELFLAANRGDYWWDIRWEVNAMDSDGMSVPIDQPEFDSTMCVILNELGEIKP